MIEHDKSDWDVERQIKNIKNRARRGCAGAINQIIIPLDKPRVIQSRRKTSEPKKWMIEVKTMRLSYPIKLASVAFIFRGAEGLE